MSIYIGNFEQVFPGGGDWYVILILSVMCFIPCDPSKLKSVQNNKEDKMKCVKFVQNW